MKKQSGLVVTSKWTYLLLACIPAGIIKTIIDYSQAFTASEAHVSQFVSDTFISLLITLIGTILFVKLNTRSAWMNPDHPESKEEYLNQLKR